MNNTGTRKAVSTKDRRVSYSYLKDPRTLTCTRGQHFTGVHAHTQDAIPFPPLVLPALHPCCLMFCWRSSCSSALDNPHLIHILRHLHLFAFGQARLTAGSTMRVCLQEPPPAPAAPAFTGETIVVDKEALKPYLGQCMTLRQHDTRNSGAWQQGSMTLQSPDLRVLLHGVKEQCTTSKGSTTPKTPVLDARATGYALDCDTSAGCQGNRACKEHDTKTPVLDARATGTSWPVPPVLNVKMRLCQQIDAMTKKQSFLRPSRFSCSRGNPLLKVHLRAYRVIIGFKLPCKVGA
eukprot:1158955-Pelagomonas_calceolata.AAC.19